MKLVRISGREQLRACKMQKHEHIRGLSQSRVGNVCLEMLVLAGVPSLLLGRNNCPLQRLRGSDRHQLAAYPPSFLTLCQQQQVKVLPWSSPPVSPGSPRAEHRGFIRAASNAAVFATSPHLSVEVSCAPTADVYRAEATTFC